MLRKTVFLAIAVFMLSGKSFGQHLRWSLDLETGAAFCGSNDVRIPGDSGTRFSFSGNLNPETVLFVRGMLSYSIGKRGRLSFLAAPLTFNGSGAFPYDVEFAGKRFSGGTPLRGSYRFNSYRITYSHALIRSLSWDISFGLTLKIREARIRLESAAEAAENKNIGLVPLIHFRADWSWNEKIGLLLEGDALAAPQGRAEDVILALRFRPNRKISFKAGYRVLEGGADNEKVYTFAWIHYAVVGASWHF